MFYGINTLVSFLCCYIGLIFLLICAALLALKQLTETTDNIYRYGLLQKLGAKRRQINRTLFVQTAVFFAIPLAIAGIFAVFLIGKAMMVVEEFMNIHISTNIGLTMILFLFGVTKNQPCHMAGLKIFKPDIYQTLPVSEPS